MNTSYPFIFTALLAGALAGAGLVAASVAITAKYTIGKK